jgi:hypothetical protein
MPGTPGNDDEVAGAERPRDLAMLLANGELTFASEDVKQFVALRMQFPRRPSYKAPHATNTAVKSKVPIGLGGSSVAFARSTGVILRTASGLRSWTITRLSSQIPGPACRGVTRSEHLTLGPEQHRTMPPFEGRPRARTNAWSRTREVMRLLLSSSDLSGGWRGFDVGGCDHVVDVGEELAGDVALEAADDLLFGPSLGGAAGDVVLGGLV